MTSVSGRNVRHAVLLYGSLEELLAAAVPFLAAGLGDGDAVVLACRPEHTALLADATTTASSPWIERGSTPGAPRRSPRTAGWCIAGWRPARSLFG
jgi:hypothetical protein